VCVCVCVCVLVPQPVLGADAQLRPFGDHYFTLQLKVRDKSHRKLAENSLFPRLSVIHRRPVNPLRMHVKPPLWNPGCG